jgi:hypothetical protein
MASAVAHTSDRSPSRRVILVDNSLNNTNLLPLDSQYWSNY